MDRSARLLTVAVATLTLGAAAIALGQRSEPERTVEGRIQSLEQSLANLNYLVQTRTETSGPQDRISRDYNLDQRLSDIERRVQQLSNEMQNLQRQTTDAVNIANQAQRDALMAQRIAQDAAARIR